MKTKQFAALLLAVLMLFAGCAKAPEETTTEAAPQTNYGENDVTALSDYSVKTASPDDDVMNAVIAVNDKDEPVYTNRFLQFSFWMEFYRFMNSYGSYASQLGLDTATPLNKQNSLAENRTWEQYMLESATKNLADSYALAQAAAANGYQLSEENEQMIASITDENGEFIQEAKNNGYDTADAYLQANFGGGVDAKTYQDYMRLYYTSYDYSASLREEIGATITDADVEAEYDANAASYQDDGVLKVNNVSVRHVLIQPEGDKDTTTGDWTEEQWTAAEEKANELYEAWQSDPTEDAFAAMAEENSADGGSKQNGGLYEDVKPGQTVTEFNDWCFDQSRQPGDSGIVKTDFGYHIMYFVGQTETKAWMETVRDQLVQTKLTERMTELREQYPVRFDFTQIRIFDMVSYAVEHASDSTATEATETTIEESDPTEAVSEETETTEEPKG